MYLNLCKCDNFFFTYKNKKLFFKMKTFKLIFASLSSGLDRYFGSTLTALLNEMESVNHSQFSSPQLWG